MAATPSTRFAPAAESAERPEAAAAVAQQSTSIVTWMKFAASPDLAWDGLMFYEEIAQRPPLHLRLLLPLPIRTEGCKSQVGDEARCLYEGGHLLKRVTQIDRGRHYEFEVVEQNLLVGGGVRLSSGGYMLRELPDGRTEVALKTRYVSTKRPRWLWKRIEAAVCHTFHRHILGAMRRKVQSWDRLVAGWTFLSSDTATLDAVAATWPVNAISSNSVRGAPASIPSTRVRCEKRPTFGRTQRESRDGRGSAGSLAGRGSARAARLGRSDVVAQPLSREGDP